MTRPYLQHGSRHTPGTGSDPIPIPGWPPLRAFGTVYPGPTVPANSTVMVSFTVAALSSDESQALWQPDGSDPNVWLCFGGAPIGTNVATSGWAILTAAASWPDGTNVDCRIHSPSGYDFLHDAGNSFSGYDGVPPVSGRPTLMDHAVMNWDVANAVVPVGVRLTNHDGSDSAPEEIDFTCTAFYGLPLQS